MISAGVTGVAEGVVVAGPSGMLILYLVGEAA
jgi:hypothetical protein